MDRSFTVIKAQSKTYIGGQDAATGGRFISKNPASAARKAVSSICRRMNLKSCNMKIQLMETTRGGGGKIFSYQVRRVNSPVTVERGGMLINYRYKIISKALK
jgi:hypothetical protein